MSSPPAPKITRRLRLPLIWVVPLVAAIVAVWLLSREWRSHGQEIEITFSDGSGIVPGRTKLEFKGVDVGVVERLELAENFSGVRMRVQLERSASELAREGSQFWIVRPEIDFSGISGIEALVGGVHLRVQPGDGAPATSFQGLAQAPAPEATGRGPAFILRSETLGSIHPGAPVLYRGIRVGEVETSLLAPDATAAMLRIRLPQTYAPLVRTNTRFWNAGGLPIQVSLFGGGRNRATSIQALVTGAIELATPDEPGERAADGSEFELHPEPENAWLEWRPLISINPQETAPGEVTQPEDLPKLFEGETPAPE